MEKEAARVDFIVTIFKLAIWIVSQTRPNGHYHLVTGVRTKTSNGHHVTLTNRGLLKEFYHKSCDRIPFKLMRVVYEAKLPNVEQGTVNHVSVTITRVGHRLCDAIAFYELPASEALRQVQMAVEQLHSIGIAHCDICVSNVFVDFDGCIYLGDLEYCRLKDEPAPVGLARSDSRATTAEQLDHLQLEMLQEEIVRL